MVLEREDTGAGFVTAISRLAHGRIEVEQAPREPWPLAHARLWTHAKLVRSCWLDGEDVVRLARGHGLAPGDAVAWFETSWRVNVIEATDGVSIRLRYPRLLRPDPDVIGGRVRLDARPNPGAKLAKLDTLEVTGALELPLEFEALAWVEGDELMIHHERDACTSVVTPQAIGDDTQYFWLTADALRHEIHGYRTQQLRVGAQGEP